MLLFSSVARIFLRGVKAGSLSVTRISCAAGLEVTLTGQQSNETLHRHFVPAIVNLQIAVVQINSSQLIVYDGPGINVARVACNVLGQHENDAIVGDAECLDRLIDAQHVGRMTIVEPVGGRVHQHRPAVCRRAHDDTRPNGHKPQHQTSRHLCQTSRSHDTKLAPGALEISDRSNGTHGNMMLVVY